MKSEELIELGLKLNKITEELINIQQEISNYSKKQLFKEIMEEENDKLGIYTKEKR